MYIEVQRDHTGVYLVNYLRSRLNEKVDNVHIPQQVRNVREVLMPQKMCVRGGQWSKALGLVLTSTHILVNFYY